jgi:hypothetical protein
MLISSVMAAVCWAGMALIPKTYNALLYGAILVNVFMVMASTATGAVLVEAGQAEGATGRLSSLRLFVQNVASTLNGYAGGKLAMMAFFWVAGVNSLIILSLFPATFLFLRVG